MLNQIRLHLNDHGSTGLINNFCYNLIKRWEAIRFDRNTIEKTANTKKVNDNLNLNISTANTG